MLKMLKMLKLLGDFPENYEIYHATTEGIFQRFTMQPWGRMTGEWGVLKEKCWC